MRKHLGVAFKRRNNVAYFEYNREFYAVSDKEPTFCFSDPNLVKLEEKVDKALKFWHDSQIKIETGEL